MASLVKKILDQFNNHKMLYIIIIAIIFGLSGGATASLFVKSYIIDNYYNIPLFGEIDFSKSFKDQGLVIRDAKKVVVEQNQKVNEIISSVDSSLVGIFKKIPPKTSDSANKNKTVSANQTIDLNSFYRLDKPAGQGFIITSDGWIITDFKPETMANIDPEKIVIDDYLVITSENKIYTVDKLIKDNLTSFNFLHVLASDFPVRKFADSGEIKSGNQVLAVNWLGSSFLTSIAGEQKITDSLIFSSDGFIKKLILTDGLPENFKGGYLFDLAGDILGFIDDQGDIKTIDQLKAAINSLLKFKTIKRPALGINYIDLANLVSADALNSDNNLLRQGVIIYKPVGGTAVVKNSAAEKAGLKEGDIIVSINNIELNKNNNLVDIMQNFITGDKIRIVYYRNGEQNQAEVMLGQVK